MQLFKKVFDAPDEMLSITLMISSRILKNVCMHQRSRCVQGGVQPEGFTWFHLFQKRQATQVDSTNTQKTPGKVIHLYWKMYACIYLAGIIRVECNLRALPDFICSRNSRQRQLKPRTWNKTPDKVIRRSSIYISRWFCSKQWYPGIFIRLLTARYHLGFRHTSNNKW